MIEAKKKKKHKKCKKINAKTKAKMIRNCTINERNVTKAELI